MKEYSEETWILGKPFNTIYGEVKFYTYFEYLERMEDLAIISFSTLKFYYLIRKQLLEQKAPRKQLKELMKMKEVPLLEFLRVNPNLLASYIRVFGELITHKEIDYSDPRTYYEIEEEDFLAIRDIIMKTNLLVEEKLSISPRVQDLLDRGKELEKRQNGEPPNSTTILSTINAYNGTPYKELGKMTAYQILATYRRISAFKDFELASLIATVTSDINLNNHRWDTNMETHTREEKFHNVIDGSQFTGEYGDMF